MIDLMHKYAMLEDGTIERLQYYDGEPREAYLGTDGKYYLDHDVLDIINFTIHYCHSRIIRTANRRQELEVLINGKTT